ncbi:MAG: DUF2283 domain-containing protein [Merismopediaceae bacterium]|nr:DUF2283 domain-containing protein [Merismopediaceae bacterium]
MVTTSLNPPDISCFRTLANAMQEIPQENFWTTYDAEADVLCVNFQQPAIPTDDSELTDDDIVIRYKDDQIIGLTFLNIRKHNSEGVTH